MSNHDDRSGLLPTDAFDVALRDLRGLPNGAHTNPRTIMNTDEYGNTTTYIVQVVKWEGGETGFVQTVSAGKPERYRAQVESRSGAGQAAPRPAARRGGHPEAGSRLHSRGTSQGREDPAREGGEAARTSRGAQINGCARGG